MGECADFDDCVAKNQDKESPEGYCAVIHKAVHGSWPADNVVNLPDISDVSLPTMIGTIKEKPSPPRGGKGKRHGKPVDYKGVRLSRRPMKFEAQILALTEIPPRLDGAVLHLSEHRESVAKLLRGTPPTLSSPCPRAAGRGLRSRALRRACSQPRPSRRFPCCGCA